VEEEVVKQQQEATKREELKARKRLPVMTPGPGAFDLPRVFGGKNEGDYLNNPYPTVKKAPAFSMSKAHRDLTAPDEKSDVGPGKYRPNEFVMTPSTRGAVRWVPSPERVMSNSPRAPNPAPCLDQCDNIRYARSPQYGFGRSARFKMRTVGLPGPGVYDPKADATSKMATSQEFSFGIRDPHQPREKVPRTRASRRPASMETYAGRTILHSSFGTSQRLGLIEKGKDTPGPGQYGPFYPLSDSLDSAMSAAGPKWSMTPRSNKHSLGPATI
jgi:hypothetical protein